MAQRLTLDKTVIISKPAELCRLFYDPKVAVKEIERYGEKLLVTYNLVGEGIEPLATSAKHIACLTTSHARRYLYSALDKIESAEGRVVYCGECNKYNE